MTVQFAAAERDAYAIALRRLGGIAYDRGAVRVPADSIASTEDSQRAERFQASRACAQAAVGAMAAPGAGAGKTGIHRHQAGADAAEAPAQIEGLERAPERLVGPLPHSNLGANGRRSCFEGSQPGFAAVQARRHGALDAMRQPVDVGAEIVFARHD